MERDPAFRVCVGCYNQRFAEKFGRKARKIARQRFALSGERSAACEWETEAGGVFRACGVGSPPMGEGFDLLILDDPIKSRAEAESQAYRDRVWDWYTDDLYSRLEPDAAIILIVTRWHLDDIVGRIQSSEDAASWEFVTLPAEAEDNDPLGRQPGEALCPDRYPLAALADRRRVMGEAGYLAMFQQRPVPREGALFKAKWWQRYHWSNDHYVLNSDRSQVFPQHCRRIAVMDPAGGISGYADYTAIGVYDVTEDNRLFVAHMERERIPVENIPRRLKVVCERWRPDYVMIENVFNQGGIVRECRSYPGMPPVKDAVPDGKKKAERATQAIIRAESGQIFIPDDPLAFPWLHAWEHEHEIFTGVNDERDDQVDCTAYVCVEMMAGKPDGGMPMVIGRRGTFPTGQFEQPQQVLGNQGFPGQWR
jgi:predicted phage terminase large subunit-like protein